MGAIDRYSVFYLKIIIVVLFIFFNISRANCQESFSGIIEKIMPSVVTVNTYGKHNNKLKVGSGFFINSNGDVITNCHVIEKAAKIEIISLDGAKYNVKKIVAENKSADIVQIATNIPPNKVHFLKISERLPKIGDRILVFGSPLGFEQTVADGLISAIREIPTFGKIIQISAPVSPGSSGGPVVNLNGEVVGVAAFQIVGGQNLNFAIPAPILLSLKRIEKQITTKPIEPSNLIPRRNDINLDYAPGIDGN